MLILLCCVYVAHLGHIDSNAGFAAPHLCQTNSPPLHPEDPGHLHPDRDFWLLGKDVRLGFWPQNVRDGSSATSCRV